MATTLPVGIIELADDLGDCPKHKPVPSCHPNGWDAPVAAFIACLVVLVMPVIVTCKKLIISVTKSEVVLYT